LETNIKTSLQVVQNKEDNNERLSGDEITEIKRTNTYVVDNQEKSPIIETLAQQEEKMGKEYMNRDRSVHEVFGDKSSSEDDDEFIRRSILNNQTTFQYINSDYMEKSLLQKVHETEEEHVSNKVIVIGTEEKINGLAKLCDEIDRSLNCLVTDKNDRIFTNFDCLLFYFEVSDAIKLQKCSRSLCRIFNPEQIKRLVRIGNLDSDLRAQFWIHQVPFFSYQNMIKEKIGETDFFVNVYE
jgi:hypothetical protein